MKDRFFILKLLFVVSLTFADGCRHSDITVKYSHKIVSRKERSLLSYINPHISDVNILIIDEKKFEHVRGVNKFYLDIPKINAILFIVDKADYSIEYHVFKLDKNEDILIRGSSSVFGNAIGLSADNQVKDVVQLIAENELELCTLFYNKDDLTKICDYINLSQRAIIKKNLFLYDRSGKLIREESRGDL